MPEKLEVVSKQPQHEEILIGGVRSLERQCRQTSAVALLGARHAAKRNAKSRLQPKRQCKRRQRAYVFSITAGALPTGLSLGQHGRDPRHSKHAGFVHGSRDGLAQQFCDRPLHREYRD
jgi:hypothetical protein